MVRVYEFNSCSRRAKVVCRSEVARTWVVREAEDWKAGLADTDAAFTAAVANLRSLGRALARGAYFATIQRQANGRKRAEALSVTYQQQAQLKRHLEFRTTSVTSLGTTESIPCDSAVKNISVRKMESSFSKTENIFFAHFRNMFFPQKAVS